MLIKIFKKLILKLLFNIKIIASKRVENIWQKAGLKEEKMIFFFENKAL